jgi:hypothetical protein
MIVQRVREKLPTTRVAEITVFVTSTKDGRGRYEVRLPNGELVCISATPFFAAARKLIAIGYDPHSTLVMRHAGSDIDSLRFPLWAAAALTVEETKYGPKLRRWKAISTPEASPSIAPNPVSHTRCRLKGREFGDRRTQKLNEASD